MENNNFFNTALGRNDLVKMYFAHVPLLGFCCYSSSFFFFLMEAIILGGNIVTPVNSYATAQLETESWKATRLCYNGKKLFNKKPEDLASKMNHTSASVRGEQVA